MTPESREARAPDEKGPEPSALSATSATCVRDDGSVPDEVDHFITGLDGKTRVVRYIRADLVHPKPRDNEPEVDWNL